MRKHHMKQCQTWSRILPTPMILLLTLLISALVLFSFLQTQPTVLHQSPWECILGTEASHCCQYRLVTSDTNQRTRGKVHRGSLCQHLWREDNHFLPLQRPFVPRILPTSWWQQRQRWRNSNSSNLALRRHLSSSWEDDSASQVTLLYHRLHPCHQSLSSCAPGAMFFLPALPEDHQTAAHYVGSITFISLALR